MTQQIFVNNYVTALTNDISTGATVITVDSLSGFPTIPSGDFAKITLKRASDSAREICRVDVVNLGANQLTVVRGQENTAPLSFKAGDVVSGNLTAEFLNDAEEFFDSFESDAAQITQLAADTQVLFENAEQFNARYLGAQASNPVNDNNGNPVVAGAVYLNTTVPELRYYDGSVWGSISQDANTLDGLDSTQFVRSDVDDDVDGVLTFNDIPLFNGGTSGVDAPFTVDSTFLVINLNAEFLGDKDLTTVESEYQAYTDSEITTLIGTAGVTRDTLGELSDAIDTKLDATAKADDSELLDGLDSLQFLRSDVDDTFDGNLDVTGNLDVQGSISGPAVLIIDPAGVGDNTGVVVIAGDLQVDGTTTTINSTTLEVSDLTITVAKDATTPSEADGAGIDVEGASASFTYHSASDSWRINKRLQDDLGNIYFKDGDSLDADTLDTLDSTQFLRSDVADDVDDILTFNAIPQFNGGTSGIDSPFTVDSAFLVTNLNAEFLNDKSLSSIEAEYQLYADDVGDTKLDHTGGTVKDVRYTHHVSTSSSFDSINGNMQTRTAAGDETIEVTLASTDGSMMMVKYIPGAHTISIGASIDKWISPGPPSTIEPEHWLGFWSEDDGTTIIGQNIGAAS